MKILLATHQYFPEHIGGTEIYTHGIAKRLLREGIEVAVATYREDPSPDEEKYIVTESEYQGIRVFCMNYNLSKADDIVVAEYNNKVTGMQFKKILGLFRPTLVHFTHLMKISASVADVCRVSGIPYMISLTDFWSICLRHTLLKWNGETCNGPEYDTYCLKCFQQTHGVFSRSLIHFPGKLLQYGINFSRRFFPLFSQNTLEESKKLSLRNPYIREQILNSRLCLTLSRFQKEVLVRNGFPDDRIRISKHGLETGGYSRRKTKSESRIINMTYVGSVAKHKGVHLVLEALKRSHNQNLKINIYGNISENDPYHNEIRKLAAEDKRVMLKGTVPFEMLGKVYDETDIVLMPSLWYENEPLVVKSAIFLGIPVIANNIGSLKEMIIDKKSGWLLPPGDLDSWIRMFNGLSRAKINKLQLSGENIKTMDENFEEIYAYYKQLSS